VPALLILIGLAGIVVAAVALVRGNLSKLRIPSRKVATGVLVGAFVVFGSGAALASPSTTQANVAKTQPALVTTSIAPAPTQAEAILATTVTVPTTTATPPRTATTTRVTPKKTATKKITPPKTTTDKAVPASTLTCSASMSNSSPTHNNDTTVRVSTGTSGASVTATAHYKSKDTTHSGTATSSGRASITFDIATAKVGYPVVVSVSVSAHGQSNSCSTSFTPIDK
jgi:hypothetical protein